MLIFPLIYNYNVFNYYLKILVIILIMTTCFFTYFVGEDKIFVNPFALKGHLVKYN